MGAWGTGSFDNDDALDWIDTLQAEGLPAVETTLHEVDELSEVYLEAPVCSAGLAAAEVVAALRGNPAPDLPGEVTDWVEANPGDPDEELTALARRAVDLVAAESELAELWAESGDAEEWRVEVARLRRRLE